MKRTVFKYTGISVASIGFVSSIIGIVSWLGINLHIGGVYIPNPLIVVSLLFTVILLGIKAIRKPELCTRHIGKNGLPYHRVMGLGGKRHTVHSVLKDGHWYKVCTCQDNIPEYWKQPCWHIRVSRECSVIYKMKRVAS